MNLALNLPRLPRIHCDPILLSRLRGWLRLPPAPGRMAACGRAREPPERHPTATRLPKWLPRRNLGRCPRGRCNPQRAP